MTIFRQPGPPDVEALVREDEWNKDVREWTDIERKRRQARDQADAETNALRQLVHTPAHTITPRRVRWLWAPGQAGEGRIPMGELTLIVGRGGVGKSTLLTQMAAWITTGNMEGEYKGTPRDVLYVANEDSLQYTVVPRLIAAGADLTRVHFIGIRDTGEDGTVLLPTDCDRIKAKAAEVGAVAIMLDPLSSNLKVDNANDAKKMRAAIEAIRRMCEEADIAAIGLAHTRKAQSANLMDAIMGSSELGNVCRSAMGVMADPEAESTIVLSQEKSNLGRVNVDSYLYQIDSYTFEYAGEHINTGQLNFLGKTDKKVSEMLSDSMSGITSVGECQKWLGDFLESMGQSKRSDVVSSASKEGFKEHTLKRAATKLHVRSQLIGFPAVAHWDLPITQNR